MADSEQPAEPSSAAGPRSAQDLLPIVYAELRRLAHERMGRERSDHTLGATALVHEAFLRIAGDRPLDWDSKAQFFAAAAEAMRRILIDHARNRGRLRRGGERKPITLSGIDLADDDNLDEVLAVDEVFERLRQQHPEVAEVVRLRFYCGLSEFETAALLQVSDRTIRRHWNYARAWLFEALRSRD
ncbi:MAG: ECF-type sigma factor [Planctomycetota bacterium]